jgi:hypothetical protein
MIATPSETHVTMLLLSLFSAYAPTQAILWVSGVYASSSQADCIVKTPNGRIIGHRSSIQPEVCEFLGVSYAAAPVGQLRFAPPEAQNLTGDFIADTWVSRR